MKWDKGEEINKTVEAGQPTEEIKAGSIMLELCMLGVSVASFLK
jgi:hypothetical protein